MIGQNRAGLAGHLSDGMGGKMHTRAKDSRSPARDIMTSAGVNQNGRQDKLHIFVIIRSECCECTYKIGSSSSDPVTKQKDRTI